MKMLQYFFFIFNTTYTSLFDFIFFMYKWTTCSKHYIKYSEECTYKKKKLDKSVRSDIEKVILYTWYIFFIKAGDNGL